MSSGYYYPQNPTTVLLMGSTGKGKRAIWKYLLNSEQLRPKEVREYAMVTRQNSLTVVNIPGLKEGESVDIKRTIKTVKTLESISACILCVKYNSEYKDFKANVDYYQKLLPRLFEDNLIVVVYHFDDTPVDSDSFMIRVAKNLFPQRIIECYYIDDPSANNNPSIRKSILSRASSLRPVPVAHLKVMKTHELKESHDLTVAELDDKISKKKSQFVKRNLNAEKEIVDIYVIQGNMYQNESIIRCVEDELRSLDTKELVSGEVWHTSKQWTSIASNDIKIKVKWPIIGFSAWSDYEAVSWNFPTFQTGRYEFNGDVSGPLLGGLRATVTVLVHRRDKYSERIEKLKKTKDDATKSLGRFESELDVLLKNLPEEIKEELKHFNEIITEIKEEKLKYCLNSITVNEMSQAQF